MNCDKIFAILTAYPGNCRFQVYYGYNQHVAMLTLSGVCYRGDGDTPANAIKALLANIRELSPVLSPGMVD